MKLIHVGLLITFFCPHVDADDEAILELKRGPDEYRVVLRKTGRELAMFRPDAWQGNVTTTSSEVKECGIAWPHFLMNSEGNWLTDRVECSES